MAERKPMTQTIKASEARQQWSQLLNKVFRKETRVVVEKSGIPVAVLISAEDFQRLSTIEQEQTERFKALDETRDAFKDVPAEELEQEVAKAIASVRRKRRQEVKQPATTP